MMRELVQNQVLIAALLGWFIAQTLKLPIHYFRYKRWSWALWFSAGGMPSSHSSLITATTLACGLYEGFDSPVFALAFAVSMVILYDAAGVRRQAGIHAQRINALIEEFFSGHPISQERLKEVLGHTPREVLAGMGLGIAIAVVLKLIWP
ncbi:MAG TPA: divergent PAP2 family protein [Anaerolineaceae bacterium]|jgi:acid phosphatase family membrane protein YuiD|nr:divergent PAP2 family protein [Chloroflexota bacterium]HOU43970.1 divergent PAP2 family protein [Anaerolineaceae bacterium]HQH35648.1 divergent PAP2 family protein [Anaerolineaceae bacterium]HQJ03696.1 divergent PAP2 family protein [Anaerolineaceae bacterium]HQO97171.1 divergent PAP2 family protein [Anaerolineaceae bacterium]